MMKKIYRKPNLAIESLATEEIMANNKNALASAAVVLNGNEWKFLTVDGSGNGTGNMLNSIDYTQFNQ